MQAHRAWEPLRLPCRKPRFGIYSVPNSSKPELLRRGQEPKRSKVGRDGREGSSEVGTAGSPDPTRAVERGESNRVQGTATDAGWFSQQ